MVAAASLLYLWHWVAAHLYLLTSWAVLAVITIVIARWQWERVEIMIKRRLIREMERKAGVPVSIEALRCRPLRGELGLTNLIVKGSEGKWQHNYFMKVHQLTCKAHGGLLGCASLAGMVSFDLGTHLPFVCGFKGKMVDVMTCAGMEVYVETSHTGASNADFLREIDRADRRKTRARGRKAHEAELRWKLCWVSDQKEKAHLATTLAALLEEDEEERLAEEALWEHQHHGDAEHAAFFDAVHSHLNDSKSHRENFLQHHDRLRLKHHKLLQSRSERKAMAKSFKALRATDANHELMHVGRCTIQNCTFALGKHTFHLERHAVVEAFSGTLLEFQRAVSRKVVSAALSDSWAREKEVLSHWSFFGRKSSPSKSPSSVAEPVAADDRLPKRP